MTTPKPPDAASAADPPGMSEIGTLASWSVSSCKPGFGVEQLVDPAIETLWQSEGPQPHLINIQFIKRMAVSQISMYVDVAADDSYTPRVISIRAGTYHGDLQEVKLIELDQPKGWQHFKLGSAADAGDKEDAIDFTDPDAIAVKAHLVQIAILSNHLNGKDTHVHHVKIWSPRETDDSMTPREEDLQPFTSIDFLMYSHIR